jgi:hypothetical protein
MSASVRSIRAISTPGAYAVPLYMLFIESVLLDIYSAAAGESVWPAQHRAPPAFIRVSVVVSTFACRKCIRRLPRLHLERLSLLSSTLDSLSATASLPHFPSNAFCAFKLWHYLPSGGFFGTYYSQVARRRSPCIHTSLNFSSTPYLAACKIYFL